MRTIVVLLCCGLLAAPPAWAQRVLFDQGHGQRFVIEGQGALDLSSLAAAYGAAGAEVASTTSPLSHDLLTGVGTLVISGAFSPFSMAEHQAILRFVAQGGSLVVALHVGPLNGHLLALFGVGVSNGAVLAQENRLNDNGSDFSVINLAPHPLLEGVSSVRVYGVWALNPGEGAETLLAADERAWMDLNRNRRFDANEPVASFSLAVVGRYGAGRFAIFGDDAIFQNRFLRGDNAVLAQNLVRWTAAQ